MNLTQAQREAVEQFAASFFEKSEDVISATYCFQAYIERRLTLREKQAEEGKS